MKRSTRRPCGGEQVRRAHAPFLRPLWLLAALTLLVSMAMPAAAQLSFSRLASVKKQASPSIGGLLRSRTAGGARTRIPEPVPAAFTTMPDEWGAGCPVPTLQQWIEPGYLQGTLQGHERCGALQGKNDWTCFDLLQEESGRHPEGPGIFARSLESSGVVAASRKVPAENKDAHTHFEGELGSPVNEDYGRSLFTSGDFAGDLTSVDRRLAWSTGPDRVQFISCEEYAYERYYEVANFRREVGHDRHDYLKTFRLAFGPWSSDAALGTHHLDGSDFLDIHGDPVLPSSRSVYRNAFLDLPGRWDPAIFTSGSGGSGAMGPSLFESLRRYSDEGAAIVAAIEAVREPVIEKGMAYYQEAFENLTVEGAPRLGFQQRTSSGGSGRTPVQLGGQAFTSEPASPQPIDITGQVPLAYSGGKVMRRMFAHELDELHDLGEEQAALVREWESLNVLFESSGWDITELLDAFEIDDLESVSSGRPPGGFRTAIPNALELKVEGSSKRSIGGLVSELPPPPPPSFLSEENAARKAVLDALIDVYARAMEAECIADFPTPCDFSTKDFALNAVPAANEQQQAAYEECLELMPPKFMDNLGTTRKVVDPEGDTDHIDLEAAIGVDPNLEYAFEDLMLYECWTFVPEEIDGRGLRQLKSATERCKSTLPEYRTELAGFLERARVAEERAEAQARLAQHSDFVDPDTGEIRSPGISSSWDEDKGSKYFGLGMGYGYAFDTHIGQAPCDVGLTAGGDFHAHFDLLTHEFELVDVAAWIKTREEAIDIHANVMGRKLFTGIERNGLADGEEVKFTFARTDHSRKEEVGGFQTTIMAGPVPITVELGAGGRLGFRFRWNGKFVAVRGNGDTVDACPTLDIDAVAEPYANAFGFVAISIDVFIAKAGIRGELVLLDVSIPVEVAVGAEAFGITEEPYIDVGIGVDMTVGARFETLSGALYVFCELGFCPAFCTRLEKSIVKWDGFTFDKDLFSRGFAVYASDMRKAGL